MGTVTLSFSWGDAPNQANTEQHGRPGNPPAFPFSRLPAPRQAWDLKGTGGRVGPPSKRARGWALGLTRQASPGRVGVRGDAAPSRTVSVERSGVGPNPVSVESRSGGQFPGHTQSWAPCVHKPGGGSGEVPAWGRGGLNGGWGQKVNVSAVGGPHA